MCTRCVVRLSVTGTPYPPPDCCVCEGGVGLGALLPRQLRNDEEGAAPGERAEDTAAQRSVFGLGKRTRGMVRSPTLSAWLPENVAARSTSRQTLQLASSAPPRQLTRARVHARQASCAAYMISSCAMVLMNKVVLSGFGFTSTNCLLLYQTVWCAPPGVARATDTLRLPPLYVRTHHHPVAWEASCALVAWW